ncbi:hypothetical protein NDU88_000437 [Pleurodeles waltl]|uniref:Uncharacterized protein n=1 Tax=Pleurodeles waltl TaxID=8319 RepID=A0AAV7N9L6_PLEWA|nr:hypothetical protein NDU88_000437 [Pleurodeles waltl]
MLKSGKKDRALQLVKAGELERVTSDRPCRLATPPHQKTVIEIQNKSNASRNIMDTRNCYSTSGTLTP